MNLAERILSYAHTYFDVAGLYRLSIGENALILGLESTPQRNLDHFKRINNRLFMRGFEQYVQPGLQSIIASLEDEGVLAKPIGQYGYASEGTDDFINYKNAAIKAGLGKRGKNTIVINPVFGTRLRFAALKIDAFVETTGDNADEGSPFCQACSVCINECPASILEPHQMLDASKCLANSRHTLAAINDSQVILCDICLTKCPANEVGVKE
jgi:epoxyqueuosine reductase QueG